MDNMYSPKEASEVTGASPQIIRVYTNVYTRYFSSEATPEAGEVRRLTGADLKTIKYIYEQSKRRNRTRKQITEQLAAGELDNFAWQAPEEPELEQPEEPEQQSTHDIMVPLARLQAAEILVTESREREKEALERIGELHERIGDLERSLGQATGELAGFRQAQYRAPAWFRWLFGGQDDS